MAEDQIIVPGRPKVMVQGVERDDRGRERYRIHIPGEGYGWTEWVEPYVPDEEQSDGG